MVIWGVPDLLPSAVPQLAEGEKVLLNVNDVGLYNGDVKSPEHVKGMVFLTTQRLVYVDSHDPIMRSVQISLAQILDSEYIPGFLKTSPKVSLQTRPLQKQESTSSSKAPWICSICSFANPSSVSRCETCGVVAQDEQDASEPPLATAVLERGECPQCTFRNHPSLRFCEMCGASLRAQESQSSSLGPTVMLSFRKGRSHAFYEQLKQQLDVAGETPAASRTATTDSTNISESNRGFGIHRLRKHTRETQKQSISVIEGALKGPLQFKLVAAEVVAIAERLGTKTPVSILIGVDADDETALARQMADLLIGQDLLHRAGGMITLHDLFALVNRWRGINLVSPHQIVAALNKCSPLNLPLRVRTLDSGLKVVESRGAMDQALQRLIAWIVSESRDVPWRAGAGFSARDVSDKMQCSVQIAAEELVLAEQRGKLCRDEHTSGIRFFPNLFLDIYK